jgi:hypothetical protein
MRGQGAGRRGRSRVAVHHLPTAPTGEPHEISLGAAFGEPLVGEGVSELVRVQVLEARLSRSAPRHLAEPARRQWPAASKPERFGVSLGVRSADPEVPIEGLRGAVADPDIARSSPLRLDEQERQLVEIYVLDAKPGDLREPRSGVDEHSDDRGVTSVLEARAVTSLQQVAQLIIVKDRRRCLGHPRRRHVPHRGGRDFAFLDGEAEEALQRSVAIRGRRGLPAAEQGFDERPRDVRG